MQILKRGRPITHPFLPPPPKKKNLIFFQNGGGGHFGFMQRAFDKCGHFERRF